MFVFSNSYFVRGLDVVEYLKIDLIGDERELFHSCAIPPELATLRFAEKL
jgi:hypothetical protein